MASGTITAVPSREEFNTLNNNLAYKLVDSKSGTTAITLPDNWKELIVQTTYQGYTMSAQFIRQFATANLGNVGLGAFGTSFSVGQLSLTQAKLSLVQWSGTDVTSSSTITVYYR